MWLLLLTICIPTYTYSFSANKIILCNISNITKFNFTLPRTSFCFAPRVGHCEIKCTNTLIFIFHNYDTELRPNKFILCGIHVNLLFEMKKYVINTICSLGLKKYCLKLILLCPAFPYSKFWQNFQLILSRKRKDFH